MIFQFFGTSLGCEMLLVDGFAVLNRAAFVSNVRTRLERIVLGFIVPVYFFVVVDVFLILLG